MIFDGKPDEPHAVARTIADDREFWAKTVDEYRRMHQVMQEKNALAVEIAALKARADDIAKRERALNIEGNATLDAAIKRAAAMDRTPTDAEHKAVADALRPYAAEVFKEKGDGQAE